MVNQSELDRLLQKDWREEVIPNLGFGQWITVFEDPVLNDKELLYLYTGLVPKRRTDSILRSHAWGISADGYTPLHIHPVSERSERSIPDSDAECFNDNYVKPLVIVRNYDGLRDPEFEILQDFCVFHQLWFNEIRSAYVKFDDSGDAYDVIRVSSQHVRIRRKEIRQFLAVKSLTMVLFFRRLCYSLQPIDLVDEIQRHVDPIRASDGCVYSFFANELQPLGRDKYQSLSIVSGKKVIKGLPLAECGIWPFDETAGKEYERFIVGVDDNDKPVLFTCDPGAVDPLSFSKTTQFGLYMTLVYFKKKVLAKYEHFDKLAVFQVGRGYVKCGAKWRMKFYDSRKNNDQIMVFLGDLQNLPYAEQLHWKSMNVPPIDSESFKNCSVGKCVRNAQHFKNSYASLQTSWHEHFGWALFRPLVDTDSNHLKTLRSPTTNDRTELESISISLSKLFIEGINFDKLRNEVRSANHESKRSLPNRSLPTLREYLSLNGYDDSGNHVGYLQQIQSLRDIASHRKDNKPDLYKQINGFFSLDSKSTVQVADDIFTALTEFLDSLREHFCPDESD